MRSTLRALVVAALISTTSFSQQLQRVTPKSIWVADTSALQEIREKCGRSANDPVSECFLSIMQNGGASPEALTFSRLTGSTGYLSSFLDLGPIGIAFVNFPFRANETQGVFIVNGSPAMIDVDQQTWLAHDELKKNLTYTMIAERTPQVSVWPGNRNTGNAVGKRLPHGGVRITFPYILRNGCRACDVLGTATFAFDFERSGRFLGTKLLGVSARQTPFSQ